MSLAHCTGPTQSSPASDRELFETYAVTRDAEIRDELVRRFMPLASQLARRYARNASEPLEDLQQVAALGLLKAVDRYDAARGTAFTSFAVPTILGEIKRHFRDTGWALRVPRELQELSLAVRKTVEDLTRTMMRSPSAAEVARALDKPVEDVLEALESASAQFAVSLDAPPRDADPAEGALQWYDSFGEEDHGYERVEWQGMLSSGIKALPERDRAILALRFRDGLTQAEIGERIGVSQMHVSRLLRRTMGRLRAIAEN